MHASDLNRNNHLKKKKNERLGICNFFSWPILETYFGRSLHRVCLNITYINYGVNSLAYFVTKNSYKHRPLRCRSTGCSNFKIFCFSFIASVVFEIFSPNFAVRLRCRAYNIGNTKWLLKATEYFSEVMFFFP